MTQNSKRTILLVEDVLPQAETYASYLRVAGFRAIVADTGAGALKLLEEAKPDALVLDLKLPDMNGLEILRVVRAKWPHLPVIVATADTSAQTALDAMREGAIDFIIKPFPAPRLTVTITNALAQNSLEKEVTELRQSLGQTTYHKFVGQSSPMQAVYRIIDSVASSKASVFITGESGTGKELAARALHDASPRRNMPFAAINCGAIPHELLESHIFGHVKGAFTGAINTHAGAARAANGGTLFLDEVCELPLDLQVKLLRFLQTSEVTPVGSNTVETVDVRIIAATNRNPLDQVKAGKFREDLYYRLHVIPLEMPALRERDDDVLLLAHYFLLTFNKEENKNFCDFTPEVMQFFRRYEWPGNVRQLENLIHQIVVLNDDNVVRYSMIPTDLSSTTQESISDEIVFFAPSDAEVKNKAASSVRPLWLVEKEAIIEALDRVDQDVQKAATLLEVSPSTLYRKLQSWKAKASS